MNSNLLIGLIVAAGLLGAGIYLSSSGTEPTRSATTSTSANTTDITPASQVATAIAQQSMSNVVILDVRTDQEWSELHADGALHWGLTEKISNGQMPDVSKDTEIYVYCRSGNRSEQAITAMREAGFTNLTNIGGLDDWIAAGGATTAGDR